MTYTEMVYCISVGIAIGMVFKLFFELLFYSIKKITDWMTNLS